MACLINVLATLSTIGPNSLFLIVILLVNYMSWINLNALDFFGIINQWLDYGAIESLSIPIYIFSFNKLINLVNRALGIGIGFKSYSTCGIIKITIGTTIIRCIHPISFSDEAKALPCLKNMS